MRARCLWLALLAAACAGESGREDAGALVDDSAGVAIVRNGAVGAWGARAPALREVLRLGVVDGADAFQFHQILGLALAADGTIYVGNNQTATLRAFSPRGEFLWEAGGHGRGPGEYVMVNRVWLAGDGVAVTDWQRGGRTGVYARTGELLHFWNARRPDGGAVWPVALTPLGWIARYDPFTRPAPLPFGAREPTWRRLYRFDPDRGEVTDSILTLPGPVLYGAPEGGREGALFSPPLHQLAFDAAGHLYVTLHEGYRIDVFDDRGRPVRSIRREYDPVPIRERDIERLKAMVRAFHDTLPPAQRAEREDVIASIDRMRRHEPRRVLSPLFVLLVSPDGSFWIERSDAGDAALFAFDALYGGGRRTVPRRTHWDVFDAGGRYLTSVALATGFRPLAVRGLEVAGVLKDAQDVEYVVVYRVERR